MFPSASVTRYLTASRPSAYFAAMPSNAAISIHSNAPAPPTETAEATPTIFPVPTVAERAVHSAAKLDTSPVPPLSSFIMNLKPRPSLRSCTNPSLNVSVSPQANIRAVSGIPHRKLSIPFIISVNLSNPCFLSFIVSAKSRQIVQIFCRLAGASQRKVVQYDGFWAVRGSGKRFLEVPLSNSDGTAPDVCLVR